MGNHRSRRTLGSVSLASALVTVLLVAPIGVLAASFVVTSIPGAGWIQGPDNSAGLSAVIVESPAAGLGTDSVELTTTSTPAFVGIGRPLLGNLADLEGGSWMTYVTTDQRRRCCVAPDRDVPARRRVGVHDAVRGAIPRTARLRPDVWQTTTLDDETVVWQTNTAGSFCTQGDECTFAEFKAQYPNANTIGLQVAIGTEPSRRPRRTLTACR